MQGALTGGLTAGPDAHFHYYIFHVQQLQSPYHTVTHMELSADRTAARYPTPRLLVRLGNNVMSSWFHS